MSRSSSSYNSICLINFPIIIGIVIICICYYFLKPSDLKVARYYESLSSYRKAISYYKKALSKTRNTKGKIIIYQRLATLYRTIEDYENFLNTARKIYSMNVHDKSLYNQVLQVEIMLWKKDPENKKRQKEVLFWARLLNKRDFIKNFLVWNGRFLDALALYEDDYKHGKLSITGLKKAVKISLWTDNTDYKIIWLKRYLKKRPDDIKTRDILIKLFLGRRDYDSALLLLKPPKTKREYYILATIYAVQKKYDSAIRTYIQIYERFKDIEAVEKAYFLALDHKKHLVSRKLLRILSKYKKRFALAYASYYYNKIKKHPNLQGYVLKLYLKIWEKWRDFSALKISYELAFRLRKESLKNKLIIDMFEYLINRDTE